MEKRELEKRHGLILEIFLKVRPWALFLVSVIVVGSPASVPHL